MGAIIPFDQLSTADLTVDAVYEGGTSGTAADDPLSRLLPCGNQGGFRYAGSHASNQLRMVVLYTSGADPDWPDALDRETGLFTYFGDNRAPGKQLHDTPRQGNRILRWCFEQLHSKPPHRELLPPFFVFSKANPGAGRDVRFLGLAVPGSEEVHPSEDLVAIWRTSGDQRFQNYRSTFTILDVATVRRGWIEELREGQFVGPSCPIEYLGFAQYGIYTPLESPRNIQYRTKHQQLPSSAKDEALIRAIYDYFVNDPYGFEACAIELWKLQADAPVTFVATRRSADGGRDAYGWYYLGPKADRIKLEWSLEAKLYAPGTSAGVKQTSRLISRLRHREFGVFVTTSYVGKQAYEELRGDQHPVVIIAAQDIVALLRKHGYTTPASVSSWLAKRFPCDVDSQ
jgi:hypothetical protein